ncbi:MAG: pseudouridine-5'-phosphate glycosidase [Mycobacteriales bacterium]
MTVLAVKAEVERALSAGGPVVALESTIISHGLPRPDNLRVAREVEQVVREAGAVPATIAVLDGQVRIGLDDRELEQVATRTDMVKVSVRDVATLAAGGGSGATTVAATAHLAARVGIRVFATGGLGGVHREARDTWDESADLYALARTDITVVCAGVKSILDVGGTLERLESLGVAVLGYRTGRFPGFYLTDSGFPLEWRVESADEIAAVMAVREELGTADAGLVVANPLPPDEQVDPELHDRVLAGALAALAERGVSGKDVTPFLLDHLHRETGGETLRANARLVIANAGLAARIAVAYAGG